MPFLLRSTVVSVHQPSSVLDASASTGTTAPNVGINIKKIIAIEIVLPSFVKTAPSNANSC